METIAHGAPAAGSGISNSTEGPLNRAALSAHAAVNSLAGSADEAARSIGPAIDRVAVMAHQAVDNATGAVAPTADWLTDRGASLTAMRRKLVSDTSSYVSSHPLKAVGIAVVAGFLLSRIFH